MRNSTLAGPTRLNLRLLLVLPVSVGAFVHPATAWQDKHSVAPSATRHVVVIDGVEVDERSVASEFDEERIASLSLEEAGNLLAVIGRARTWARRSGNEVLHARLVALWDATLTRLPNLGPPPGHVQAAVASLHRGPCTRRGSLVRRGNAFFVSPDGHMLTTYHEIVPAGPLVVRDADGREHPAAVLFADPVHDVALLKCDVVPPQHLVLHGDPNATENDERVWRASSMRDAPTEVVYGRALRVDEGTDHGDVIVSALRSVPGHSGSPLVNARGRVVGMHRAAEASRSWAVHGCTLAAALARHARAEPVTLTCIPGGTSLENWLRIWGMDDPAGAAGDSSGIGPLQALACHGDPALVRHYFNEHPDASADDVDVTGRTGFEHALRRGHLDVVRTLIDCGADPNRPLSDGRPPIIAAIGEAAIVEALIAAGADVHATDEKGFTAFIHLAHKHDHTRTLEALLDAGVDVNAAGPGGRHALAWAARAGHEDSVRLLCRRGAAVDAREPDDGWTALMHAAAQGWPDALTELLLAGAAVDLVDAEGRTVADVVGLHAADGADPVGTRRLRDFYDRLRGLEKDGRWDEMVRSATARSAAVKASDEHEARLRWHEFMLASATWASPPSASPAPRTDVPDAVNDGLSYDGTAGTMTIADAREALGVIGRARTLARTTGRYDLHAQLKDVWDQVIRRVQQLRRGGNID